MADDSRMEHKQPLVMRSEDRINFWKTERVTSLPDNWLGQDSTDT
jgi:hypothetical protein